MLVVSRKIHEKIIMKIGTEVIEVTIENIESKKVKIGIQASENVSILRSELVQPTPAIDFVYIDFPVLPQQSAN